MVRYFVLILACIAGNSLSHVSQVGRQPNALNPTAEAINSKAPKILDSRKALSQATETKVWRLLVKCQPWPEPQRCVLDTLHALTAGRINIRGGGTVYSTWG